MQAPVVFRAPRPAAGGALHDGLPAHLGGTPEEQDPDALPHPGPTLVLEKDEPVAITVVNHSHEPAAVHWHGIELESFPDGVPGWSGQGKNLLPAIPPHDSLTVRFTPPRAGTFMYHSHFNEHDQIAAGLYGAIVVLEPGQRFDRGRPGTSASSSGSRRASSVRCGVPLLSRCGLSAYRPELRRTHLLRYWLDPQVVCQSRLANTLWFLGEAEAAVRARDAALALANQVAHPDSRAVALVFAALLAVEMEDTARLREYVSALETRNREDDGPQVRVGIEVLRAYLRVFDGEVERGITRIRSTLADPSGVEHAPGMRAVLARLLLAAFTAVRDTRGRLAAAEHLLRLGGAARLWEAEAHRARAECLAELGAPPDTVEAELEQALEVARRQGARALEEKAAESLLRYRQNTRSRRALYPSAGGRGAGDNTNSYSAPPLPRRGSGAGG